MDSFSSSSMSSSGSPPNPEAVMEQLKTQLAQVYAQELMETLGTKCFAKCDQARIKLERKREQLHIPLR